MDAEDSPCTRHLRLAPCDLHCLPTWRLLLWSLPYRGQLISRCIKDFANYKALGEHRLRAGICPQGPILATAQTPHSRNPH